MAQMPKLRPTKLPLDTPHKAPRVAILVDTATGWGRRLVHGVIQYAKKHGPWKIWVEARGQQERLRLPQGWEGEGVIARVSTMPLARDLLGAGIPVVNVSGILLDGVNFPRVVTDLAGTGQLATQHFLDRGFRHFAYYGSLRLRYVAALSITFAAAVAAHGYHCAIYRKPRNASSWKIRQAALGQWLLAQPKPLAVLAWSFCGLEVLDACRWVGLSVPEQVAVLGGDDDELLCNAASPPISGIETPSDLMGYQAAAWLDDLMHGTPVPLMPKLLQPTRVTMRGSTDILSVDDPEVADALRFIRENAGRPITVSDVLQAVPVSRRSLERRFATTLARTPAEEIRKVHLERAQQLLVETDLSIAAVASAAGFGSPEYMSQAFKAVWHTTPLKYRSRIRVR